MNSVRLKKAKDKKFEVKEVTTFILTVVIGSLVHTAGSTALRRPTTGSAPSTSLIL